MGPGTCHRNFQIATSQLSLQEQRQTGTAQTNGKTVCRVHHQEIVLVFIILEPRLFESCYHARVLLNNTNFNIHFSLHPPRPLSIMTASHKKTNNSASTPTPSPPFKNPYLTLLITFAAWKAFLFAIAIGSTLLAGEAYDTSGSLVVRGPQAQSGAGGTVTTTADASGQQQLDRNHDQPYDGGFLIQLTARFTSWDAIYFVTQARRGYRFEQEWAFGAGLPMMVRGLLFCKFVKPNCRTGT